MLKLLTLSLCGLIVAPCNQIYAMEQPTKTSWFSQNPVAAIATAVGTAAIGYTGYILKKRYDKKEKLISKKEAAVGITASLAAGAFFLQWHRNYHIIAPHVMVPNKELPYFIPWSQSEVLWKTLKDSSIALWESTLAAISNITGILVAPLKAVRKPIDSALGVEGACVSLIPPLAAATLAAATSFYYLGKSSYNDNNLYAPKKEDCKGFASIVGGVPDLMHQVMDLCQATPKDIQKYAVEMPKGIVFHGPPGTGKTALARAFAEELILQGVKTVFLSYSAPELKGKFVGESARNVRSLFQKARSYAQKGNKVIVFIDEIDALVGVRQESDSGDGNEGINQFLVELDGINQKANNNIIIIGATNRFNSLDKAVTRGGRLEYHIEIPLPDLKAKKAILNSYAEKAGMIPKREETEQEEDIEAYLIAALIDKKIEKYLKKNLSGADIEALVKQAQMIAFHKREKLSLSHIDQAINNRTYKKA
jgi:AAA+ superfamily predicted ATPase